MDSLRSGNFSRIVWITFAEIEYKNKNKSNLQPTFWPQMVEGFGQKEEIVHSPGQMIRRFSGVKRSSVYYKDKQLQSYQLITNETPTLQC